MLHIAVCVNQKASQNIKKPQTILDAFSVSVITLTV